MFGFFAVPTLNSCFGYELRMKKKIFSKNKNEYDRWGLLIIHRSLKLRNTDSYYNVWYVMNAKNIT